MANYTQTLLTYTGINAAIVATALALLLAGISTDSWLTTPKDEVNGERYGLLGYSTAGKHGEYEHYSYKHSDAAYKTGLGLFIVLLVAALHNVATLVLHLLVFPFHYFNGLQLKTAAVTVTTLSTIVQFLSIIVFSYLSASQRRTEGLSYGFSYWLVVASTLLTGLGIYGTIRTFNAYIEWEYLPSLDSDEDTPLTHDPRDVLYPLRQKVKGGVEQVKNAVSGNRSGYQA